MDNLKYSLFLSTSNHISVRWYPWPSSHVSSLWSSVISNQILPVIESIFSSRLVIAQLWCACNCMQKKLNLLLELPVQHLFSRNLQTHGFNSKKYSEVKVLLFCIHFLIVECLLVSLPASDFVFFCFPEFLIFCIHRILFGNFVHGGT